MIAFAAVNAAAKAQYAQVSDLMSFRTDNEWEVTFCARFTGYRHLVYQEKFLAALVSDDSTIIAKKCNDNEKIKT